MRLEGARIAGAGGKALPSLQRPGVAGGFSVAVGKCGEARQLHRGVVALEGAKQFGSRSGGTGVDNGKSVAPRGPMRGEAVGGGRAEAETPKPLSELGSAEALVWQRGGLVLE